MYTKFLAALALTALFISPAQAQNLQQHLNLIGVTSTVQAQANGGAGITFGIIDTGGAADWVGFSGRVDKSKSACEISRCNQSLSYTDDNGHGTFVTSEIIGNVPGKFYGVAPQGKAIEVKALNSQGSGLVSDVARGITYAVSKGAQVLNLSMTFIPTSDLIGAINAAAAKGVIIVFAGGNDGAAFQKGAKVKGLTDKAIQNLILMGSTNAYKNISYFSTKPGTGGFTSSTGKFYSYASRWMMADGEALYGASNYHDDAGYHYLTMMSGTSMAAPQAAGAAGLVAARWPFLITNGTVASVLLASTQDLGAAGVDATYGSGFMRVDQAFQPVGGLSITVNGKTIPISQAQLQANGGVNAAAIKQALSKGVGYDNFKRDFPVKMSSSVSNTSSTNVSVSVYSRTAGSSGESGRSFTDFGEGSWMTASLAQSRPASMVPSEALRRGGFTQGPSAPSDEWSMGFYTQGNYMGGGRGTGAAFSFNDARWGSKTAFFDSSMAGAGSLLALNTGAGFASGGFSLGGKQRLAFSVMTGKDETKTMLMGNEISSQGFAAAYTFNAADDLDVSLSTSFLKEKNALLGSATAGYLRMGENATTMAVGMSANYNLGDGLQIGFDATVASTEPGHNPNSLIASTSRLTSAGFGIALRKDNLTGVKDTLTASIRQPLHVLAGNASMNVPVGADPETGDPVYSHEKVNLAPKGMETDFALGYTRPLAENTTASFAFEFRNDANNIPGATDQAVMFRFTRGF
ncbi:MAG: S8 family serine peptidase [Proteobacteria bacterium]|nr:S8 family serine peptidase [Pseudomonadota bacterium]